jgi:hypothetical protein
MDVLIMSRNYSIAFKKTNPRSVRGAEKRGWHVIDVREWKTHPDGSALVSWLGLEIWSQRNSHGHFVSNFMNRKFAFELEQDASAFMFQWTL